MEIVYIIIFFVFGLAFGSFYNVVGFRLGKNENIIFPSSHCMECNHKLKFYENIPIVSYIFLKGRCKNCKEKISILYPVVELFTGILFALSYYSFGFSIEIIPALLIIVIVTDLSYYIILDSILVIFGVLMFIYNIITMGFLNACTYVLFGFVMFAFMFILMKLGNFLFKEESLGGGDIKLMGVLGMSMNPLLSFCALTIGAISAIPGSLYFYLKKQENKIPFGPFIVAGFLIILFTKVDIQSIIDFVTI